MNKEEKDAKIVEFIKGVAAIEYEMEPYKEQAKELRTNFVENGWLTKEEVKLALKAYRLLRSEMDVDKLTAVYEELKAKI